MKQYGLLILAVIALTACESTPRSKVDQTRVDPALEQTELIDIAIAKPMVGNSSDGEVLAASIRTATRKVLIDHKRYAVPRDAFVDAATSGDTRPGELARAAGSDAALVFTLDQWETDELLPKGRIYAGGNVQLVSTSGSVMWQRTFKDWARVAPRNVTASNRLEVTDEMLRDTVRELLVQLPAKPRR